MTKQLKRDDPKTWDGYLVLMTPNPIPLDGLATADLIRSNISRLRKLLGTGDDIKTLSDVRKTLLPLLPIDVTDLAKEVGGLDALPRFLERYEIPKEATAVIVAALGSRSPCFPDFMNTGARRETAQDYD